MDLVGDFYLMELLNVAKKPWGQPRAYEILTGRL